MSLGTNIKCNMLGTKALSSITNTFADLPDYNFMWKCDLEIIALPIAPPKNVFIATFLPQKDLLASSSIKAFITHSGVQSTQEALWHAKPMITIPFFGDQKRISRRSVERGVAVDIDFSKFSVETFKESILKILENRTFTEKADKVSNLFKDKPHKPLDLAIWWIEYVIRNPSALQFDSPSLKLGSFAANSYDVIASILVALSALLYAARKLTEFMKNFCACNKCQKHKST